MSRTRYQELLRKADVLDDAARKMDGRGRPEMAAMYRAKAQELADQAQDLTVEEGGAPA